MSNIRIKDLTTTAATTASDDFVAVDGTTNGTRKLNAFSPTFGGNATVTGTLTVNGVATAGSYLTSAAGLAFPGALSASGYYLYSGSANGLTMYGYGSTYDVYIGNRAGTRALSVAANSTVVSIPDTTASTTTSTGALVVGNGTSGGLGVGGSINCGGNATVTGTLTVNNPVVAQGTAITGYQFLAKDTGGTAVGAAYALQTSGGTDKWRWGLRGSAGSLTDSLIFSYLSGSWSDALTLSNAGVVSIPATTASTSTSSGALVVSGGVGVAGAIYAGGDIITTKSNGVIKASGSSANAEVAAERLTLTPSSVSMVAAVSQPQLAFTSDTAGSYTWGRILANSSEIVRVHSANLTAIANVAGAGIAVAGGIINTGSLTTGAPSGGTAAAWKLGTVASVSPTSPNRTIEVDIGGTIYYIHAKTTNN
jgi:hypothetical protein